MEPSASESDKGSTKEGEVPSKPSPMALFVRKDGDNALLHLVAEFLAWRVQPEDAGGEEGEQGDALW